MNIWIKHVSQLHLCKVKRPLSYCLEASWVGRVENVNYLQLFIPFTYNKYCRDTLNYIQSFKRLCVHVIPVSGCSDASHDQPLPSSACPLPGWAAAGSPCHLRLHQAVWTGRNSGGSTQRSPDSAVLAAPPGQWSPERIQTDNTYSVSYGSTGSFLGWRWICQKKWPGLSLASMYCLEYKQIWLRT